MIVLEILLGLGLTSVVVLAIYAGYKVGKKNGTD